METAKQLFSQESAIKSNLKSISVRITLMSDQTLAFKKHGTAVSYV